MLKLLKLLPLFLLFIQINTNFIAIDLAVNQTEINVASSYTFTLKRDFNPIISNSITPSSVSTGSIIQFIFPGDFVNLAQSSTVPCTDTQSGLGLTCEVSLSTNMITVKDYYSS